MKNIKTFIWKFSFFFLGGGGGVLGVKFSVYLNSLVFVMLPFYMWRLFYQYLFLISPYFGKSRGLYFVIVACPGYLHLLFWFSGYFLQCSVLHRHVLIYNVLKTGPFSPYYMVDMLLLTKHQISRIPDKYIIFLIQLEIINICSGHIGIPHLICEASLWHKYSRLSLSRIPRDSLKNFEISVPRHIRFAELRKK